MTDTRQVRVGSQDLIRSEAHLGSDIKMQSQERRKDPQKKP